MNCLICDLGDSLDLIKEILKRMTHLTEKADDKGYVPLHHAVELEHTDNLAVAKLLLQFNRSAAYRKDNEGRTPLHIAASLGRRKIMMEIIQVCPDCCELVDNRGWNVLHFVAKSPSGVEEIIKAILQDSSFSNLINRKDKEGNAPLHLLAASNDIPRLFLSHLRLDKMAFNNQNHNALDTATNREDKSRGWVN